MLNLRQTAPEAIRAENLVKTYDNGVVGLNGVNLSIFHGEMVGVLGASGSGKTTFFRLINGSIAPTKGDLRVLGQSFQGLSYKALRQLRSNIATISQHHNIIPGLSVAKNVQMGKLGQMSFWNAARTAFYLTEKETEDIYQILNRIDLTEKIFDRATDLSGGQQQRVAIARALLGDARIIIADEPIASVDSRMAEKILNIFKQLNLEKQITIVMNLHQEDFALDYCSRIVVLSRGSLVYNGPPGQWARERGSNYAL